MELPLAEKFLRVAQCPDMGKFLRVSQCPGMGVKHHQTKTIDGLDWNVWASIYYLLFYQFTNKQPNSSFLGLGMGNGGIRRGGGDLELREEESHKGV